MSTNPWDLQKALREIMIETDNSRFLRQTNTEYRDKLEVKMTILEVLEEVFDRADYSRGRRPYPEIEDQGDSR